MGNRQVCPTCEACDKCPDPVKCPEPQKCPEPEKCPEPVKCPDCPQCPVQKQGWNLPEDKVNEFMNCAKDWRKKICTKSENYNCWNGWTEPDAKLGGLSPMQEKCTPK